jgi:heat shock protein HslJ
MKRTLIAALAAVVAVVVLAGCGSGGPPPPIVGILWKWNGALEVNPHQLSAVPNPDNYLITFAEGGQFQAKADCNQFTGTYELGDTSLTITPGPMTKAACGDKSLADQFVTMLGQVKSWSISENELELGLKGGGAMFFRE